MTTVRKAILPTIDPQDLIIIGIDKRPGKDTVDGPEHFLYDGESVNMPLDLAQVEQIAIMGVKSPVAVRRCPDDHNKLEVVTGRTRVRWCREANKLLADRNKVTHRIKYIIEDGSDADLMALMIAENEIRRTPDSPIAKARKVRQFMQMGRTQREAALHFGTTQPNISTLLKLLEAAPELQEAAEKQILSTDEVRKAVGLPVQEQRAKAKKAVEEAEEAEKAGTTRRARKTEATSKVNEAIRIRALTLATKLDEGLKGNRTVGVLPPELAEIVALLRFAANQISKAQLLNLISVDLRGPQEIDEDNDDDDDEGRGH